MQLKKLIEQRSRSKSHKEKCDLTLDIALHHSESGDHDNALVEYKRLLELYSEKDDKTQWAQAHRFIADCCIELGDFAQAIKHTNDYLKLSVENENKLEQQRAYVTLGRCFLNRAEQLKDGDVMMRNLKSASLALMNSIKLIGGLATTVSATELGEMRAVSLLNLGQVFRAQRDYASARERFQQCISLARKYQFQKLLLRACYQLTDLALNSSHLMDYESCGREALLAKLQTPHLRRALEILGLTLRSSICKSCSDVESKELLRSVKESYANIYLSFGQFRKAAKVYRLLKLNFPSMSNVCRQLIRKSMLLAKEFQQLPESVPYSVEEHIKVARIHERLGDLYAGIELHGSALTHYRLMLLHGETAHRLSAAHSSNSSSDCTDIAKLIDAALISVAETHRALCDYEQCAETYRREIQWVISNGLSTAELAGSWFSLAQAQRLCFAVSTSVNTLPGSTDTVDTLNSALRAAKLAGSKSLMVEILSEMEDYFECHGQPNQASQYRRQISDLDVSPTDGADGDASSESSEGSSFDEEALTQYIEGLSSDSEIDNCVGHPELLDEFHQGQRGSRKSKALCLKTNMKGETPLHVAAISGDMEHVVRLIEVLGHPVNVSDGAGWLPIHEAAFHDRTEVAIYLLDRGARLDDLGCPLDESTPLFEAIHNGSLRTARMLVSRGADLWHRNKRGECLPELLDCWQPSRRCSGTFGEQRSMFEDLMTAIRERLQGDYERWCNQPRSGNSQRTPRTTSSSSSESLDEIPMASRRRRRSPSPSLTQTMLKPSEQTSRKSLRGQRLDESLEDSTEQPYSSGQPSKRHKEAVETYKAAMRAVSGSVSRSSKDHTTEKPVTKTRKSLPVVDLDETDWLVQDQPSTSSTRHSAAVKAHFRTATVRRSEKQPEASGGSREAQKSSRTLPLNDITHAQNHLDLDFAPHRDGFTSTQVPSTSSVKQVPSKCLPSPKPITNSNSKPSGPCTVSTPGGHPPSPPSLISSTQPVSSGKLSNGSTGPYSVKVAFPDVSVLVPVDDASRSISWIASEAYRRRQILTLQSTDEDAINRVQLSTMDGALLLPTDRLYSILGVQRSGTVVELLAELGEQPPAHTQARPLTEPSVPIPHKPTTSVTSTVPSTLDRIAYITSSPFFKDLRERVRLTRSIDLAYLALGDADCCLVLNQLRLHGLRNVCELHLQGNCLTLSQSPDWFQALSHLSNQLTTLNLEANAIKPEGLEKLFGCFNRESFSTPAFPRLQRLSLAYNPLLTYSTEVSASGFDGEWGNKADLSIVHRLASVLPKLSFLDLSGCFLRLRSEEADVRRLTITNEGHTVSQLSELKLSWNPHLPVEHLTELLSHQRFAGLRSLSLRGCASPETNQCPITLPITATQYAASRWCLERQKLKGKESFSSKTVASRGDELVKELSNSMTKGKFHLQALDLSHCLLTPYCLPALKILLSTPGTSLTIIQLDHNPGLTSWENPETAAWCEIFHSSASPSSALVSLSIDFPEIKDNDDDALTIAINAVERKLLPDLCPTPLQKLTLYGAPSDWNPSSRGTPAAACVTRNAHRLCHALLNVFSNRFGTLSQCKRERGALMFGIL